MELQIFKTLWGHEDSFEEALIQAQQARFQGVESSLPHDENELRDWADLLEAYQLEFIAEVVTGGDYVPMPDCRIEDHLYQLEKEVETSLKFFKPVKVTSITGYDAWSEAEGLNYFETALKRLEDYSVEVCFETHRSRSLFNPWVTQRITQKLPELNLTLDMSHWCVVCERLMDSEMTVIDSLLPNIKHMHARVGYAQGPQVPHPAAPEFATELKSHQNIWQKIWRYQSESGMNVSTMTPEFGPDRYMHQLPFTEMDVADLWQINQWMGQTQQAQFKQCFKA